MSDELLCPLCGNYRDTPMHDWGCPAGQYWQQDETLYPELWEDEDYDDDYPYTV